MQAEEGVYMRDFPFDSLQAKRAIDGFLAKRVRFWEGRLDRRCRCLLLELDDPVRGRSDESHAVKACFRCSGRRMLE